MGQCIYSKHDRSHVTVEDRRASLDAVTKAATLHFYPSSQLPGQGIFATRPSVAHPMNLSDLNLLLLGGEANTKLLTSSHNLWSSFFLEGSKAGSMNAKKTHSHKDSFAHEIFKINGTYRLGRAIGDLFLFLGQAKTPAMRKINNNPDLSIAAVLHCIH